MKLAEEEVAAPAAAVPVPVPVLVPAGVIELAGAVVVTPNAEVETGVAAEIALLLAPDLAPELELLDVEVTEVEELCGEMEKEPLVE